LSNLPKLIPAALSTALISLRHSIDYLRVILIFTTGLSITNRQASNPGGPNTARLLFEKPYISFGKPIRV
jgi:hypothetical protein